MSKTPTLIWAQRVEKVFVTWESLATKEVNVTFSEGLLTIEGTLANGDVYKQLHKCCGQIQACWCTALRRR